jgi:hypothetical protein
MFVGSSEFVGTITPAESDFLDQDSHDRGDDHSDVRDHGTNQHYGDWYYNVGQKNNRAWMCNTWASPSSDVS